MTASPPRSSRLDRVAAEVLEIALRWSDALWDPKVRLMRRPDEPDAVELGDHLVRETAWYAVGLLVRGGPARRARALEALDAVLDHQVDDPGSPGHGTWRRHPGERTPGPEATVWTDYDPNWREFVGLALALVLFDHRRRLPRDLVARIDRALALAAEGTLRREVDVGYTNAALMRTYLLHAAGRRQRHPGWSGAADRLAHEMDDQIRQDGAVREFGAPTYYGVDLHAARLWRTRSRSRALIQAGERVERALWADIAAHYHAQLRVLAGPYSRSYGMHLDDHVALVGIWLWLTLGAVDAPSLDVDEPLAHSWDLAVAPSYVALGAGVEEEVVRALRTAPSTDRIAQRSFADGTRTTTLLGPDIALGGAEGATAVHVSAQLHAATAHLRQPDGARSWLRTVPGDPADVHVVGRTLRLSPAPGEPRPSWSDLPRGRSLELQTSCRLELAPGRWVLGTWEVAVSPPIAPVVSRRAGSGVLVTLPGPGDVTLEFRNTARSRPA